MNNVLTLMKTCMTLTKFFIFAMQLLIIALSLQDQSTPIMLFIVLGSAVFIGWLYRSTSNMTMKAISYYHSLVYSRARKDVISLLVPEDRPFEPQSLEDAETLRVDNLRAYISATLPSLGFTAVDIRRVIRYMELLSQDSLPSTPTLKPIQRTSNVSQCDLRHLAWNIGHVLGVSSSKQAQFAHVAFDQWFLNTNIETTRRTLLDSRGGKVRIPAFDKTMLGRMMSEPCDDFFAYKKEGSKSL